MKIDVTAHLHTYDQRELLRVLKRIHRCLDELFAQGADMSQVIDDLVQTVADVKAQVDAFGPAVDAFEARITTLLGSILSPDEAAKLAAALADLRGVVTSAATAVADAGDGVDEAAAAPTP